MRIGLAQINPKVGDFASNTRKILKYIDDAKRLDRELLVFPELSIPGYPPRDLLDYSSFIDANLKALEEVAKAARGITVICGFVERNASKTGRPFHNSAAILQEGRIAATYRKQLLPYYDVFEEERYFEPGHEACVVQVGASRVGVVVCEDFWNIDTFLKRPYATRPPEKLREARPDIVVNISASPFSLGKPDRRISLFQQGAAVVGAPIILCNQVGGNDELLFDGCSFALDAKGNPIAKGPAFEEALVVFETGGGQVSPPTLPAWPSSEPEWIALALKMGLRDYVLKCGASRVCLGLSGGIDSSVVAAIAVDALGKDAVAGVSLPTRYTSSPSIEDAEVLAKHLGIACRIIPIEGIFGAYESVCKAWFGHGSKSLTLENIQPRIRMTLLMAMANEEQRLLLNTSNKSEIAMGYSTLYGDSSGALSVLGDLTKRQVYALARWINRTGKIIPTRVLERPPTAELRENQTDQDTLPPYDILDDLVNQAIVEGKSPSQLTCASASSESIETFSRLYSASEYKRRQLPPVLRISDRAFGMGRRMPIAASTPFHPTI